MTEAQFEGLRERKKRLTRQLISDTATNMFLERGFDEVRISEIAAACEVSEKTIYNYFPTKESLVLDREESIAADIRWALGPDTAGMSPVEAAVHTISEDMTRMLQYWNEGAQFATGSRPSFAVSGTCWRTPRRCGRRSSR